MPSYMITDNQTGKKFKVTGDSPPTEQEMMQIFSDMGGKSSSEWNQKTGTEGKSVEDLKQEWMQKEGGTAERVKQNAKAWVKAAVPYVKPVVEGGLATLGGIAGAAGAGPAGAVGGAALGYAGGKNIMDTLSGDWAKTPTEAATRSLKDLGTGAMYEMGGQAAGKVVASGIQTAGKYISKTPLSDMARERAKQIFAANSNLTAQEAANTAKATELTDKLGVKLTPAQMTGKPSVQAMEQGLATADPEFAAVLTAQDTAAKQAAQDRISQAMGKGRPLPVTQDLQTTGANTVESIQNALIPVKKAETDAWAQVPNYPIPSTNFDATASTLRKTPMVKDTETAVNNILDYADRMPKTTEGMQSLERTINDKMYAPNADPNTKRVLGQLKQALTDDFAAMKTAADAGDIALHEGKVVYPSKIQAEIDALQKQVQTAEGQGASLPEQNKHLFEYLAGKGEVVMQNNGITPVQYQKTLQDRLSYLQSKGQALDYTPPTNGANQQVIDNLKAGIDTKKTILEGLQPAEDVATAYRAAKDVSKARFDQFGSPAIQKVLKPGQTIPNEAVNRQYFTPSGASGLIKAVGKSAAKEQMKPFVIADMLKVAAPDGVNYNVQSGINYIQKNRAALEQLGLMQEANQVLKDQIPKELESILAKRAPDQASGSQFFTAQDMRNILQKYGYTIKQLYGMNALQSLRDYNQLMGLIERKNLVSRSSNSNTADKLQNLSNMMIDEAKGPAKRLSDGLLSAMVGGGAGGGGVGLISGHSVKGVAIGAALNTARQAVKNGKGIIAQAYVNILKEGTLNPQVAKDLMILQKTGKVPATLQTIIDNHLTTGAAIAATPQGEQP